jgi:predicted nucleic acid-binding Zn finger protein
MMATDLFNDITQKKVARVIVIPFRARGKFIRLILEKSHNRVFVVWQRKYLVKLRHICYNS